MSDPKESLTARVAAAIRAAVPDEEQCLADEDECFRKHPIHLMASRDGVVEMVFADVEGASKVVAEALERGDLPVGQQSKELSEVERFFEVAGAQRFPSWWTVYDAQAAAVVARVRADERAKVAMEIAGALDNAVNGIYIGVDRAVDIAKEHAAAPAESVVAALPDVVGTPEHHCPNCEGVDPQTCPYAAEGVINVEE